MAEPITAGLKRFPELVARCVGLRPEFDDRSGLLLDLYSAVDGGDYDLVCRTIEGLAPSDPVRAASIRIVTLAAFPEWWQRYLLPRRWLPVLMSHAAGPAEHGTLRIDERGFRTIAPDGAPPTSVLVGDDFGFDSQHEDVRSLHGRIEAAADGRRVLNLSVPEANLVQKLAAFELFAPLTVDTVMIVDGPWGRYAAHTNPQLDAPPLIPLYRQSTFVRLFRPDEAGRPLPPAAPEVALAQSIDALAALIGVALARGVRRVVVVNAPRFAGRQAAGPWEQMLRRLAALSAGGPARWLAESEAIPAFERQDLEMEAVCRRFGAVFVDTSAFRDDVAGDTFADGFTLIPAAHDRWADL